MTTEPVLFKGLAARQRIRRLILFFMVILFPILMNYFSVFLIVEGSSKGIMVFSFFYWSAWVVTALLIGRAGCGYLCPLGAFQEMKDRAAPKKLIRIRFLKVVKYVLSAAWVGAIIYFAVAAGGYKSINLLYNTESGVSIDRVQGWFIYSMIVVIILLPAFLIGKRGFCHYFCPWGVLTMLVTRLKNWIRIPSLHLESSQELCKNCHTCVANCPKSLPVENMVQKGSMKHDECILCGSCVDSCPYKVIRYSWKRPRLRRRGNNI
jgi:ferredoxin-type protein NapH